MNVVSNCRPRVVSLAAVAALLLVLVGVKPAWAEETPNWLPFKVGSGVVEVGCTWNNGCDGDYHGTSGLGPSIDFIAPVGTEVYAAGAGTVVAANNTCHPTESPGCSGGRGRYIEIAHADGRHSRYLHLSEATVTSGDVSRGQLIGKVGNSGGSPVAHLHYDETVNGSKVDPGTMTAKHGDTLVQYPHKLGTTYDSWDDVPSWSNKFVVNDSFEAGSSGGGGQTEQTPNPVPWYFENFEGDGGAVSPYNANVGRSPATITFNNQLFVFHYDSDNGRLRYARTVPGWVFGTLDGDGGSSGQIDANVGEAPAAVVYGGSLHVFYYEQFGGNLRHAWTTDGAAWYFETLDGDSTVLGRQNSNLGQTPTAIVYGTSLQVFYYDAGNHNLRHAWVNGGAWNFETLEGDTGSVSHYNAMIGLEPAAAVYNDVLHVFYYDESLGNLRHARVDGSGWSFEFLDGDAGSIAGTVANVGHNPTAVLYRGDLHVFYYDTTNGTFRHMWTGVSVGWRGENLTGDAAASIPHVSNIGSSSAAVVIDNVLHLFVYEVSGQNLVHIWDDGMGWHMENLDGKGGLPSGRTTNAVGVDPAVMGFGGKPHVFYYNETSGDLRHAWPQ